jgi:hypothetical protein
MLLCRSAKFCRERFYSRCVFFGGVHLAVFFFGFIFQRHALAAVAGQLSLSVGEEYNDNIFFTKDKEHDFVTFIFPTFSLSYAPAGQTSSTLTADFTPIGQIFARHGNESNFGDNLLFRANYGYQYSPRLTFGASETLQRLGQTRTFIGGQSVGGFFLGQQAPAPGTGVLPTAQRFDNLVSTGDELTNQFSIGGRYDYTPRLSFTGNYTFGYTSFLDAGGRDMFHSAEIRGDYRWRDDHNLHAGYTISIIRSRNGDDNVVHNFDIGDDYLSAFKINLSPTLTVFASVGLGLNTNSGGPSVAANVNISATKVWERAALTVGVTKGLTPSFGIAGISDTTSFFGVFNIWLTEFLTGFAGVDYSLYDTDTVNFDTLQASTGLHYQFTSWLSAILGYAYSRRHAGAGANSTDLLEKGNVASNSAFLLFTTRFDVWPNIGLARQQLVP